MNASAVIVPKYAKEIAEALGKKIGPLKPLPVDDPNAVLSGFANPKMGQWIDSAIEADLQVQGASDATAPFRDGPRLLKAEGGTYLRPTVVHCDSIDHPCQTASFLSLRKRSRGCLSLKCSLQ